MRILVIGAVASFLAGGSLAADVALVISNGSYGDLPNIRDVDRGHDRLADAYRDAGFEVVEGENLDRREMTALIERFDTLLPQADSVVVHFGGHGFAYGGLNWLAPTDLDADNRTQASFDAYPLKPVLQMLGEHPGEAALFLGLADDMSADTAFAASLEDIDIPQGVMVVRGLPGDVASAVRDKFLVPGRATTIARNRADDVVVEGYVSRKFILVDPAEDETAAPVEEETSTPVEAPEQAEASLVEQALWTLAEQSPSEANLGAYISRFPNGVYINEARRLMAELEVVNTIPAVAIEEALSLQRNQRRNVQRRLTVLGHDTLGVDGIFGRGTRAAIQSWQRSENLDPTGYLNSDQMALLRTQAAVRLEEIEAEEAERKRQEELADIQFWQATGAKGTAPDYRTYLSQYPEGLYAKEAQRELRRLEAEERDAAASEEKAFWDRVVGRNNADAYREYLAKYPNGSFAATASARLSDLTKEGDGDKSAEYEQIERDLGLNLASIALVEQRLKMLGYDPGPVDGRIGGKTRTALRKFQRKESLEVTGYVNPTTLQRLIVASSR